MVTEKINTIVTTLCVGFIGALPALLHTSLGFYGLNLSRPTSSSQRRVHGRSPSSGFIGSPTSRPASSPLPPTDAVHSQFYSISQHGEPAGAGTLPHEELSETGSTTSPSTRVIAQPLMPPRCWSTFHPRRSQQGGPGTPKGHPFAALRRG